MIEQRPGLVRPRLLRPDQAVIENNAGRSGGFWLRPGRQLVFWEALEWDGSPVRVHLPREIEAELGPLLFRDLRVLVALTTMWAEQPPEERAKNRVTWTIRSIHRRLGYEYEPGEQDRAAIRASLQRLVFVAIERRWYDAAKRETVREVRKFISGANFAADGRPGERKPEDRGWISWSAEYFEQLARGQLAYALDGVLLNALPPIAARLYIFLACFRMFPTRNGTSIMRFPLGRGLYENLGISDTVAHRVRRELAEAGRLICARDPIYRRIDVEPTGRRSDRRYVLVVERENRRSRAREVRRALPSDATSAPVDRSRRTFDDAAVRAAYADPLVRATFAALLTCHADPEAVARLLAFRKARIAYLLGESSDSPPPPPELEPLP
jgi:hypothetical protein